MSAVAEVHVRNASYGRRVSRDESISRARERAARMREARLRDEVEKMEEVIRRMRAVIDEEQAEEGYDDPPDDFSG